MSPVARRQGGAHTGKAVVVAATGVAFALAVTFAVATLAGRGDVEVRLGDDRFNAGDAEDILDEILENDVPIAYQDPATFSRPIWLDNQRREAAAGWTAFLALVPEYESCTINWIADRDLYVSDCDTDGDPDTPTEEFTYPRSGEGLREFPVSVVDGDIIIDIAGVDAAEADEDDD